MAIYHHKVKDTYYIGSAPVDNKHSIHQSDYFIDGKKTELSDVVVDELTLSEVLYAGDMKGHDSEWIMLSWENIESLSSIK